MQAKTIRKGVMCKWYFFCFYKSMSYQLKTDEKVEQGIQRMVKEQADKAIEALENPEEDYHEAVHEARKRFKKIRALIRLVRSELGAVYQEENTAYRDLGRQLSDLRDCTSMMETIKRLKNKFHDLEEEAFHKALHQLDLKRTEQLNVLRDKALIREILKELRKAKKRVDAWNIKSKGSVAVAPNLEKVYKRGKNALDTAYREPTVENFHEWRKRVKYLRYHTRILRGIWPGYMKAFRKELKALSDYLGDDHDLAVLKEAIEKKKIEFENEDTRQMLMGLIHKEKKWLLKQAHPLGQKIYIEKPKHFIRRHQAYFQISRKKAPVLEEILDFSL